MYFAGAAIEDTAGAVLQGSPACAAPPRQVAGGAAAPGGAPGAGEVAVRADVVTESASGALEVTIFELAGAVAAALAAWL